MSDLPDFTLQKRKTSDCPSSLRIDLPEWVSKWERRNLESLNIFYAREFAPNPMEILQNIRSLKQLDEQQLFYVESVKKFLKFNLSVLKLKFQHQTAKTIITSLQQNLPEEFNMTTTLMDAVVTQNVKRFIRALDRLLFDVYDHHRHVKGYEGVFSRFVCAFADLCCMEPITCSKGDETTWRELRGNTVISKPDLRFFKLGLQQKRTDVCISATEVKKNVKSCSDHRNGQKKQRCKYSTSGSDETTSDSYDSADLSGNHSDGYPRKRTKIRNSENRTPPPILDITSDSVLGQHGGELLLDLNRFYGDLQLDVLSIPGMIVDETYVILTLLVMSKTHLDKLRNDIELDSCDEATIYYTPPYDILCEESRGILIENLMRLNNIYG